MTTYLAIPKTKPKLQVNIFNIIHIVSEKNVSHCGATKGRKNPGGTSAGDVHTSDQGVGKVFVHFGRHGDLINLTKNKV